MRQPSTPWIVFDRRSKAELLRRSRVDLSSVATVLTDLSSQPMQPMFPPTHVTSDAPEPSNVVVAQDVGIDAATTTEALALDADALPLDALPVARATGWKVAAALALGLAVLAGGKALIAQPTATAQLTASTATANASRPVEPSPLDLGAVPPPAPPAAEEPATSPAPSKAAASSESHFGKISIRGAARYHRVYFDGKRLLGNGTRSFHVACGVHAIKVGSKGKTRELEVPCSGELVVSK